MTKEKLLNLFIATIILNLILGVTLIKKSYDIHKQNEATLYNYCRSISYVYDDLENKLFDTKNADLNNKEYVRTSISDCYQRFASIGNMIFKLSRNDSRIEKATGIDMDYSILSYLGNLLQKIDKNKTLDEKDISTLKSIIDKGKQYYTFVDSAPNYDRKYDPDPPLVKIKKLNKEIDKLCEDAKK